MTATPWIRYSGANSSKRFYASEPGVAAGSAAEPFMTGGTFMFQSIQQTSAPQGGFIQNWDGANNRGWRIYFNHTAIGMTNLIAEIGLSDGTSQTITGSYVSFPGQAVQLLLAVDSPSGLVYFSANGVVIGSLNFGPLTYAPAVGQRMELPAATGFSNAATAAVVLGACFAGAALIVGGTNMASAMASVHYLHKAQRGYPGNALAFSSFFPYVHAWDVRGLLQGGFPDDRTPGDLWPSSLQAASPVNLFKQTGNSEPRIDSWDQFSWWSPSLSA